MTHFIVNQYSRLRPLLASLTFALLLFPVSLVAADPAGITVKATKPVIKKSTAKPAVVKPKPPEKKPAPPADKESKDGKESDDTASSATTDDKDPDETKYNVEEKDPTGDHYTSVIIDATSYHITRSMCPKICRTDSTKLWPTLAYIDPDYVISYGIVVYTQSMDEARGHKRAGKNPLILRATGHAASADDPILSDMDADLLLAANKRNKCIDKFKVIFIIDAKTP